jgi:alpha-tubulin suppressor-like RCC1 family protein
MSGQVGDGTFDGKSVFRDRERPVRVLHLRDVKHIALGLIHSCAISSSGDVYCWGSNSGNELGTGVRFNGSDFPRDHRRDDLTALDAREYPGRVVVLSQAVELALGAECSCARVSDGGVYCWGHLGYAPNSAVPTRVPGLGGVVQIVSAPNTKLVCALRDTGETLCWGWNEFGVLGEDPGRVTDMPQVVRW